MKKLLFFIPDLNRGGMERVMSNLANRFAEAGHHVTIVMYRKAPNAYPLSESVKTVYLKEEPGTKDLLANFRTIRALRRVIRQEKAQVTLSFMCGQNLRLILATLGMKKVKTFVSVRNDPDFEYPGRAQKMAAKWLFPLADGVILQTYDAQKWFEDRHIRIHGTIIRNQVGEQFFDKRFSGSRKNIVNVGRLEPQKNQELLLRAFAKIAAQTEEQLLIYGFGYLEADLKRLSEELGIQDRVSFMGLTDDVPSAVIGSRLFVLSSDFEGSPNALLEALALGVPSVSTDCPCGGPREVIEDGKNGFLVPVGDADKLAEKMLSVLSLPEDEISKISETAKESAEQFRPDRIFAIWRSYLLGEED